MQSGLIKMVCAKWLGTEGGLICVSKSIVSIFANVYIQLSLLTQSRSSQSAVLRCLTHPPFTSGSVNTSQIWSQRGVN